MGSPSQHLQLQRGGPLARKGFGRCPNICLHLLCKRASLRKPGGSNIVEQMSSNLSLLVWGPGWGSRCCPIQTVCLFLLFKVWWHRTHLQMFHRPTSSTSMRGYSVTSSNGVLMKPADRPHHSPSVKLIIRNYIQALTCTHGDVIWLWNAVYVRMVKILFLYFLCLGQECWRENSDVYLYSDSLWRSSTLTVVAILTAVKFINAGILRSLFL